MIANDTIIFIGVLSYDCDDYYDLLLNIIVDLLQIYSSWIYTSICIVQVATVRS